jgi:hypothetical protein
MVKKPLASHYTTFKTRGHRIYRGGRGPARPERHYRQCNLPRRGQAGPDEDHGPESRRGGWVGYETFLGGYAAGTLTKCINTVGEVVAMAMLLASAAGAGVTSTINADGGTSPY